MYELIFFEYGCIIRLCLPLHSPVKVESVTLARPMAPERDRSVIERRVFPSDVHISCQMLDSMYNILISSFVTGQRKTIDICRTTHCKDIILC